MSTTAESVAETPTRVAGKYLTFRLGPESYGIEVVKVREIMRLQPITQVPQMPGHIKGVLNLRGKIIPVMDLRLRLGMSTPMRQLLSRILTRRGYRVSSALSGMQALEMAEVDRPDLVLLDVALTPGGDLGLSPAVAERTIALFGGAVSIENLHPPGIRLLVRLKTAAALTPSKPGPS